MTLSDYLRISMLVAVGFCAGCASSADKSAAKQVKENSSDRVMALSHDVEPNSLASPRDAVSAAATVFQVDLYKIAVPFGTFSGNEAFWKRMDEQCVDPATYDLLYKNGIRIGEAATAELDFFKKFMDEKPTMSKLSTTGRDAQRVEIEMSSDLKSQTISIFDSSNTLRMQDYDASNDVLNLSFEPTPRKSNQLRLTLCPMVRAHRKQFQYTLLNNEMELQYISPEMFYDLNLRVDIPLDHFFLAMASPEARFSTSVGHAFFTKSGKTEPMEQILLIVPHPLGTSIGNASALSANN